MGDTGRWDGWTDGRTQLGGSCWGLFAAKTPVFHTRGTPALLVSPLPPSLIVRCAAARADGLQQRLRDASALARTFPRGQKLRPGEAAVNLSASSSSLKMKTRRCAAESYLWQRLSPAAPPGALLSTGRACGAAGTDSGCVLCLVCPAALLGWGTERLLQLLCCCLTLALATRGSVSSS